MSNFQGYLLKAGNTKFNNRWLKISSYHSTPNQRSEIEAYRDDYTQNLTRVTATGLKTKIEFETMDGIDLATKMAIQSYFSAATTDSLQRKCQLTYWNDESNEYKTSYFYIPDITFSIKQIDEDNNDIKYESLSIKLVEY